MLNIITCFENTIEDQCIGLYRSIERYFDYPGGYRIFGIAPRADQEPSAEAVATAKSLGVEYIHKVLNSEYAHYPLANKPLSCAYVADLFPNGPYLFLDSDTLFVQPTDLGFAAGSGISVRQVDSVNIGVGSFDEPNGPYWKFLYDCLGMATPRCLITSTSDKPIFEYYNSGFVFVEDREIIQLWKSLFTIIMTSGAQPNEGLFFVEQSVLSAVISSLNKKAKILPADINYPIHVHKSLPKRSKIKNVKSIRHIHYHRSFKDKSQNVALLKKLGFGQGTAELIEFLNWVKPSP